MWMWGVTGIAGPGPVERRFLWGGGRFVSHSLRTITQETTRLVKQMKSGEPGETRVGICEEKFFVFFFFSTLGEGVGGLLTFIFIYAQQAASVHRLLLALFSLLRERVCFHILEVWGFPGHFSFYFLGYQLGYGVCGVCSLCYCSLSSLEALVRVSFWKKALWFFIIPFYYCC